MTQRPAREIHVPDVSVLVVNWNTRDLLRECLTSLMNQEGVAFDAHVVDNGSSDRSAEMVRTEFPAVNLHALPDNVGFSRANNLAAASASGRYLLLLNSDTEVFPGALAASTAHADREARLGAVGLGLVHADGTPQPSCAAFPTIGKELFFALGLHRALPARIGAAYRLEQDVPAEPRRVDWCTGAALLIRRSAWDRVGPLDADLFMYGEDLDWCVRATRRGFPIGYLPGRLVLHHGDVSSRRRWGSGVNRVVFGRQRQVLRKNFGEGTAMAWCMAVSAGAFPRWLMFEAASRLAPRRARTRLRARADDYRHTLLGLWTSRADHQPRGARESISS